MNKFYSTLLAVAIALSATAESKLDLHSRALLRQYKMENVPTKYDARTKSLQTRKAPATHVNGLIKLAEGATFADLEAEGIIVNRTRGRIALVTMPVGEVERYSALKSVKKLQLSREVFTKMDKAREAVGVNKIHAGEGLPQAYTGKGVITGIVDQGLAPNHINFKDENGNHRFGQLMFMYYEENATDPTQLSGYVWEAGDDISDFSTDSYDTYHGTHTTGIMAGSYKGNLTMATGTNQFDVKIEEATNPYYGIAYESEIAAACGELSDYAIAIGVDYALQYAYDNNKPAVVNLSLGSNYGAHDGKQVMCEFLEECGKEAIVCVAAGNEGDMPIALNQTFTAEDTELKSFLYPVYPEVSSFVNLRYGQLYIYSDSKEEFEVDIVGYNKSRGSIVFKKTCTGNMNGAATYYATPGYAQDGDLTDTNFSNFFQGYFGIGSMIDSDNDRYYTMIDFQVSDNTAKNATGNYIFGFIVRGKEGQRIDVFCDGLFAYMDGYGQEGWDNGSCNGSISDMACGNNILTVGAYTTRKSFANLDKSVASYSTFTESQVAPFSSYGTLIDGSNRPHVCAPGAAVISSTSTPYVDAYKLTNKELQAKYTESDGTVYYWQEAIGSSMATPVVAGSIALWLEADPTLTIDKVKEIVEQTAIKDSYVTGFTGDPVQWGAGKFDAYAGLKEVLRNANSGICSVLTQDDRLMVTSAGVNAYNVFLGGAENMNIALYNMQGQTVFKTTVEGDETNIDGSTLASGVYVLNVNGTHSQKIIVK